VKLLHSHTETKSISEIPIGRSTLFSPIEDSYTVKWRIEEYSNRILTRPSDVLEAFSGIFRTYEELSPPVRRFWGIPILPLDGTGLPRVESFMAGLCWDAGLSSSRRHGFPSWCWSGWFGGMKFNTSAGQMPDIVIDIETKNGVLYSWEDATRFASHGDHRLVTRFLRLHILTFQVRFVQGEPIHQINNDRLMVTLLRFYVEFSHSNGRKYRIPLKLNEEVAVPFELERKNDDPPNDFVRRLLGESWTCLVLRKEAEAITFAMVVEHKMARSPYFERIGVLDTRMKLWETESGQFEENSDLQSGPLPVTETHKEIRLG